MRRSEMNIFEYLQHNSYPGRGIIAGLHDDEPVIAYFIMGRSANSRNRIFSEKDGILSTEPFDVSKVADPSLIIYNAVREYNAEIIVTNGNQTDTIYQYLSRGKSFREALDTREYEPDRPNYTPRISALVNATELQMSVLKKQNEECLRLYYCYPQKNSIAYFISTYDHDGNPMPSFSSDPLKFEINEDIETFTQKLWNSLDPENKISLYVRYGSNKIICNKNKEK